MRDAKVIEWSGALQESLILPHDRFLEHSVIYALIQIGNRQATLPWLTDANPRVQQAGLTALDQMKDGNLTQDEVIPLLGSKDVQLQQTALLVVSRRPEWAPAAQASFYDVDHFLALMA